MVCSVFCIGLRRGFEQELIQNADDAGARRIAFCLDARTHRKEAIAAEALAQFQGELIAAVLLACTTDEDVNEALC
jgi:sacsin